MTPYMIDDFGSLPLQDYVKQAVIGNAHTETMQLFTAGYGAVEPKLTVYKIVRQYVDSFTIAEEKAGERSDDAWSIRLHELL